jgi:hypothetical protein
MWRLLHPDNTKMLLAAAIRVPLDIERPYQRYWEFLK